MLIAHAFGVGVDRDSGKILEHIVGVVRSASEFVVVELVVVLFELLLEIEIRLVVGLKVFNFSVSFILLIRS